LRKLAPNLDIKTLTPPGDFKDLGEMTTEAARDFVMKNI